MIEVELISYTQNPVNVIESAASTCYDSTPTDGRIMNHCYKSGHHSVLEFAEFAFKIKGVSRACYDENTEILTKDGWKYFNELQNDEVVATLNPITNNVEFNKINEKIKYYYQGEMDCYKSQNTDLVVTPNHKLYQKPYDGRKDREWELKSSEDIKYNRFYFNKKFDYNNNIDDNINIEGYTYFRKNNIGNLFEKKVNSASFKREDFYKLLAWYISEGSCCYNKNENSFTISICQLKKHNIPFIKEAIEKCGFNSFRDKNNVRFKSLLLGKFFKSLGNSYTKHIPFNLFDNFNKRLAKIFIDEYIKGDGTIDSNGCAKIYTISPVLSDQLYTLCYIAGYTASVHIDNRVGSHHAVNGEEVVSNYPCYVLNISRKGKRNFTPVIKKKKHFNVINYNGYVYCVNVPNHIIFVRRNGKAVWCGNCTHQLVRHRLASFAQRSQRYCSEDGFQYVIPPKIKNDPKALDLYENLMNYISRTYNELLERNIEPEDARFVLPNACETEICVKMDLRELIHFCNERLCACAQWEIRQLASKMKEKVIEVEPKFAPYLVPKCEKLSPYSFCTESKKRSCGRHPVIGDIFKKAENKNE